MILNFSVKNFHSVKEKAELCFTASADRSLAECLVPAGKKKALPLIALYGENSSGKTTLIKAFLMMRDIICGRYSTLQSGEKMPYEPFVFCDSSESTTEFDVEFTCNEIRYRYLFAYNADEVVYEKLYYWPNGRESLVFSRDSSGYIFRDCQSEQNAAAEVTLPNRLYLKTSADRNCSATTVPFSWFMSGVICTECGSGYSMNIHEEIWKEKFTEGLRLADPMVCGVPEPFDGERTDVYYRASDSRIFLMPVEKQSGGFSRFYRLSRAITAAAETGSFVIADDFDSNISSNLTRYLVEFIQSPELNPNHAQLLLATHDTSLMDQSLIRRDQIYITEKLSSGGRTVVHPVTHFSPRKDKRIDYGYLNGEFVTDNRNL